MASYDQVLAEHRRRLQRLADRAGVERLRSLYEDAEQELLRKIARRVGPARQSYAAHVHAVVLGQVRQGQAIIARRLAGELGDLSRQAQVESIRGLAQDVSKLEKHYAGVEVTLPIEEASRFRGIVDERQTSLLRMHATSMARYGAGLVEGIEGQLALSLATGESTGEAIDRVQSTIDGEWWRAERVVRTETAWAYNAAHADGIKALADDLGDLWMRWTEHVDDSTGQPLDDRVGVDSIAMHGQVARPGGLFTMPPDPEVSSSLQGRAWSFPPNRPNDRAVLSPWRPHWRIPAWRWEGRRVDV